MGLSRRELFKSLNVIKRGPDVEKYTKIAYDNLEHAIWRSVSEKTATSFWASSFPIYEKSCARQGLYNLLNIPEPLPLSDRGRAVIEMGKAAEYQIVHRWGKAGYTIGGSVPLHYGGPIAQLAVEDSETWLSGSLDAVLNLPGFDSVLPVDIKSKDDKAIRQMRVAAQSYDLKHYAQVQAYIYLCNLIHDEMGWSEMGLERARGAVVFYVSRDNPRHTFEFYFDANWTLINAAIQRLKDWKAAYISATLPERDKNWKWSEEPCRFCKFKKYACKPDIKEGTLFLTTTAGIEWANSFQEYDFLHYRQKVLDRWNGHNTS